MLNGMDIDAENVDKIINAHAETVEALRSEKESKEKEIAELTEKLKTLSSGAEENEKLKKQLAGYDELEEKYKELKESYSDYKSKVEEEKSQREKKSIARKLLLEAGISEKRVDSVLRVYDFSKIEVEDGNAKDKEKILENIKSEWSDFVVTKSDKGADTPTPPENTGGKKTKAEILAIKDTAERQKAMAENHELFGI
jgi:chromosome segregation ATPase